MLSNSDEPEPSWLKPQLELKYFQLGSARDLFASARTQIFQLENQIIDIFCCPDKKSWSYIQKNFSSTMFYEKIGTFDFINPHFKDSYHKNSSNSKDYHQYGFFWVPKTLLLEEILYVSKKTQLGFSSKIKVLQLGQARHGSEPSQLGSSWKIPARAHHYNLTYTFILYFLASTTFGGQGRI